MKRNRIITLAVCLAVFLCMFAVTAFAAEQGEYTSGPLEYNVLADGTVKITKYSGEAKSYTVPSEIDGKKVTAIGNNAFWDGGNLESITIPGSVREMDAGAFDACFKLVTVTIEKGALKNFEQNFIKCGALKTVILPENVETVSGFRGAVSQEEIKIDKDNPYLCDVDGVVFSKDKKILVKCPYEKSAERYIIPSTVKEIVNNAFYGVKGIENIFIPKTVEIIGEHAFAYTSFPIYTDAASAPAAWKAALAGRTVRYNFALSKYQSVAELEPKPATPKNVSVSQTTNSITLKWSKVADCNGYVIERYVSGEWKEVRKIESASTVSFKQGNLQPGTLRKFRIRAYKKINNKYILSDATATINTSTQPAKVTEITTSQSASAVRLNWNKITNASGYGIYQYIDKSWKRIATVTSGSTLTYRVSKLKSGTVYKFKVRAYIKAGGTIWGTASDTIAVSTKPAVPAKVSVTQTQSSITLKWGKVTGANGYAVFQYVSGKWKRVKTITSPSTVSYTVKNLKIGTTLKFRIKAYKKYDGATLWSAATSTITATTKPLTPKNVSVSQTESAITLKWDKVANVNGYAVFQYISGKWTRVKTITSPSTVSCTVKKLKSGATCKFRIKAYKKAGGKTYWGDATSTITTATKPAKVTPVVKAPAPGQITLTWKAASGAKLYRVYYKVNDGKYKLYKTYTKPQNLTFKNLKGGDKYTFAVRAGITVAGQTILSDTLAKSVKVAYRTTRYLNAMKSGTYYTRYKVNGVVFEEAIKGNKLYTTGYDEYGDQYRMIYNGSQKKWYYIYDQYKVYAVVNDSELPLEARGSEVIKAVKNQEIPTPYKSTKEEINGQTMFCETLKYNDGDISYVKYCYSGATLKRAYLDMASGLVVVQDYEGFTNNVPDSLFTIPSDYTRAN